MLMYRAAVQVLDLACRFSLPIQLVDSACLSLFFAQPISMSIIEIYGFNSLTAMVSYVRPLFHELRSFCSLTLSLLVHW